MDYQRARETYFGKEFTDEEIDRMVEDPSISEEELIEQLNASRLFWKKAYFSVIYMNARNLPLHRTEAGYPRCSTCDGGGCFDCTDPS